MIDQQGSGISLAPTPLTARLASIGAVLAAALVLLVLARSFAWPTTWSAERQAIGPGGMLSECFSFSTPRLMIVEIAASGGPVAVGIVPRDAAGTLAAATLAAHTVAGAYDGALVTGRIDARIDSDRDYCVVIYGSATSTMVRSRVQTYLRLW